MKTIIAGGRDFSDYSLLCRCMAAFTLAFECSEVLCGCARGADQLGERWAKEHGVKVRYFPANWREDGKGAGHARNAEMARNADSLVAFWDGSSAGTADMIRRARRAGLLVMVFHYGA